MDYYFDAKKVKDDCVQWIRDYFKENGPMCNAVIGISGGKDSSVVAALCVEALGKDRVIGIMMPQGKQADIGYSVMLCEFLGIDNFCLNIEEAYKSIRSQVKETLNGHFSQQSAINMPPRLRTVVVRTYCQNLNGRMANTSNLSEDYVGYFTIDGDDRGDFAPLANLTVGEVKAIGRELGLPKELIEKTPIDGLCGKTDEENLGFTYDVLDRYIRTGEIDDLEAKKKIDYLHEKNAFKLKEMPKFKYVSDEFTKAVERTVEELLRR